jgi:simple sugar transport system ATP-binding protein
MKNVIEMEHITKEFFGMKAVDDVTFSLREKEIHALLGENGAGKSTLMSILFGLYQPETGTIKVKGKEIKIDSPNIANELGIGMVHQHFKLIEDFSVVENIVLGYETTKGLKLDLKSSAQKIEELSKRYHLNVDVNAKISDISVGMQQRVEILKMLYRNNDILIFDEPTAVLTPQEIEELMKIMKSLIDEGKSIILITHKLKEIKMVADRCTVLRRGKKIDCVEVKDTDQNEMASMMVGREVNFKVNKKEANPQEVVLEIKDLTINHDAGYKCVNNLSLVVRKGEIYGLAGIDGNGQSDLVFGITGLKKIDSGDILLNGTSIKDLSVKKWFESGIAHVPEDRHKHGLILDFNMQENMVLHNYYQQPYQKKGIIQVKERKALTNRLIEEFDIRSSLGSETVVRQMSGGNQQKVIIAREINLSPDLLLVVQPTRGLDVGAIEYIHSRIIDERDKGKAVLLVSLELDEVMNLSDRIGVIYQGEIMGEVNPSEVSEKEIGLMMAGYKNEKGVSDNEK